MPYLEIETPSGVQRASLDRPRLTIGRQPTNDIVIRHQQISRFHAELSSSDGVWWIADLHSTNGIRTQGQRIERRALAPGQRVFLAPSVSLVIVPYDVPGDIGVLPTTYMPSVRATATTPNPPAAATATEPRESSEPPALHPSAPTITAPTQSVVQARRPTPPAEYLDRDEPRDAVDAGEADEDVEPPRASAPVERDASLPRGGASEPSGPSQARAPGRTVITYGPAASMLHQCQTCGQRTAPGLELCQYCQNPITRPCDVCHTPLLPIQDRCSRCLTPNSASVLRTRPAWPSQ